MQLAISFQKTAPKSVFIGECYQTVVLFKSYLVSPKKVWLAQGFYCESSLCSARLFSLTQGNTHNPSPEWALEFFIWGCSLLRSSCLVLWGFTQTCIYNNVIWKQRGKCPQNPEGQRPPTNNFLLRWLLIRCMCRIMACPDERYRFASLPTHSQEASRGCSP
jgi:hypothetical protein